MAPTKWDKKRRQTKISKSDAAPLAEANPRSSRSAADFSGEKRTAKGKRATESDALIVDGVELKGEVRSHQQQQQLEIVLHSTTVYEMNE